MLDSPPPLERFSADKFRRWLADLVSADAPPTATDRDSMRNALVAFLSTCPMVYGLSDRMAMWERIGNAAVAALETCNHDMSQWVNEVLAYIDASPGRVATCDELRSAIAAIESKPDSWRVECLRVVRELRFVLPALARDKWKEYQIETGTEYKGATDGN